MKILSIISVLVLSATLAHAAPDRVATVKTTVNGMVCSFCAQGILAHFKKHPRFQTYTSISPASSSC